MVRFGPLGPYIWLSSYRVQKYGRGLRYKVRYEAPDGNERNKSFPDRQLGVAQDFLNEMENQIRKDTYIDPDAGKILFKEYAEKWLAAQTFDESSREGTEIRLRLHIYPYPGSDEMPSIKPSGYRGVGPSPPKERAGGDVQANHPRQHFGSLQSRDR
ncbi:hypothetical protein ACFQ1S_01035 [Kibdelosporangium lantanae]|uniref:Integrase n=1 Tax=Kibdelosporangium lantanae TaxID=1497396 RepID=A0ABW3M2C4_9PSEU